MTYSDRRISYHWEYISFLGPNFPGMRGLILVLMSNVCSLAVNLIFLVVTARYLLANTRYCSLLGGYCSLLLIPTFSMDDFSKLLWSLNLNIVQLFGCFIVYVPTTKLIGYMGEPLELFMMTTSQLLIYYLPWANLFVFTIKISRDSSLKFTRLFMIFLGTVWKNYLWKEKVR